MDFYTLKTSDKFVLIHLLQGEMNMNTTLQTEFLKLIETRRSIRAYEPTPVPENLLQSILQAGMYAPTGGGRQSPTIVAITSKQVRDQLSAYNAKVMHTRSDPY